MTPRVVSVIMAGGRGERLWPLVRLGRPKACILIDGARSLLELTAQRIQPLTPSATPLIITTAAQAGPIRRVLPARLRRSLIAEPEAKNTAACIMLAAATVAARDPSTVMAVFPADHWIDPAAVFHRTIRAAVEHAQRADGLVTIGLRPTLPNSGLGYLRAGRAAASKRHCRIFRLQQFIEKPSAQKAKRLLKRPGTYWNTGIFVGRAEVFLDAFRRWLPEHAKHLAPLGALAGRPAFARRAAQAYRRVASVSFDHGVMMRGQRAWMVEGRFQWEDLGSWDSWIRTNRLTRPSLAVASRNVRVLNANGHLIATIGLDDAIIVHTPDATLVCRPDNAQALHQVAAQLARDPALSRYR